jgi:hypothetical protein
MKWLRSIAGELYGLFVDDVSFALSVLACVAMAALLLRRVPSLASFSGVVLFVGLALLLVRSALQFAGRGRR